MTMPPSFEPHHALRVLRALYVAMRQPVEDDVAGAVEAMGRALGHAIEVGDWTTAHEICERAVEWSRATRHPIARRLAIALGAN